MREPVVLLTGAGKGIGRAVAKELGLRGDLKPKLFLFSRTSSDLESLKRECAAQGIRAEVFAGDLARPRDVQSLFDRCLEAYGRVDCLINNAGVGRFGEIADFTEGDLDYVFDTNLKGTFLLTQRVFAQMKEQASGHLVFVTSISAEKPFTHSAVYCMSKFAQKGLVEVLRLHAQPLGIRVTHVLPGATHTPMWESPAPEMLARMMPAEEVARAIVDCVLHREGTCIEEIVLRPVSGDFME